MTSFIHNWDAAIAGMSHVPEEITLRDIFLRELRKSTKMKHDLETYERAEDGTKEHTYHWLIHSVRDLLNRDRTHKNRQQIVGPMVTSLELQHPTFTDAPTQVVAEEGQALGNAEADQERPQAQHPQAQGRRGSVTISNAGSAIGETSASTSTRLDRHRHNHERSTSHATKGTSACSGTMALLGNQVVPPDHQATSHQAQPLLPRMVSPATKQRSFSQ